MTTAVALAGFVIPTTVYRAAPGLVVNGRWVEGTRTPIQIMASIQPAQGDELQILELGDRVRGAVKVYTQEALRSVDEVGQADADQIEYAGDLYQVQIVARFTMGVLDHTRALAVRLAVDIPETVPPPVVELPLVDSFEDVSWA